MYKFLYRPKWIATHLLVIALIVLMVNLGQWQLHRHHERKEFNATLVQRFDAPIQPLETLLQSAKPEDIEELDHICAHIEGLLRADLDNEQLFAQFQASNNQFHGVMLRASGSVRCAGILPALMSSYQNS